MLDFEEGLDKAQTADDVRRMKLILFQERVRIQARYDDLDERERDLQKREKAFEKERNAFRQHVEAQTKRFQDKDLLVAKQLKILQDAYGQLEIDKKSLECEKLNFEYEKGNYRKKRRAEKVVYNTPPADNTSFFNGVDNQLALRKRYRDLMKIFHPDNRCGDTETLQRIQEEYNEMKRMYEEA